MTYQCGRCGGALVPGETKCLTCDRQCEALVLLDADSPTPQNGSRLGLKVGFACAIIGLLVLSDWSANAFWMQGTGGETAFRQHNLAGNEAVERGDFATGNAEYSQMIALRPRRVEGYFLRALCELKAGQFAESAADDTTALALSNEPITQATLYYNRAQTQVSQGLLKQAIADYTQAEVAYNRVTNPRDLPTIPDCHEDALRGRAAAYWQNKDYLLAIADCSVVITAHHIRPSDYGIRAKAEAALGRDAEASQDFHRALALDASYLEGYAGLGALADKLHQPALGVAAYQDAVRAEPGSAFCWGSLGWFQYEAGQYPQALATDEKALSIDPNQPWIHYNLAVTYAASGNAPKATAAYIEALARGTKADQAAGLIDIRNALAKQPGSAVLLAVQQQVERGSAGQESVLPAAKPMTAAAPRPPRSSSPYAKFLGPEVPLNGYAIQPPTGYTLTQQPLVTLTSTGTAYVWIGPKRADGTRPDMEVEISEDEGNLASRETTRQWAQRLLELRGENHTNLSLSPITTCQIGSMPFLCGAWKGVGALTKKTYAGSEYALLTPSRIIHLSIHDVLTHSRTSLPLLKASLLTFRKL